MTSYDVVVIGLSRAGAAVADALAAGGQRVAAVKVGDADDQADRLAYALEKSTVPQSAAVRFEMLPGPARFTSRDRLATGQGEVRARKFVIAVGASPRFPEGLEGVPLSAPLDVLSGAPVKRGVVLGGGPVAALVADRIREGGGEVTVAARSPRLLPKEDETLSDVLAGRLRSRGIKINTAISALSISPNGNGFHARFCCGGDTFETGAEKIVAATGLLADIGGLDLAKAGVFVRDGRVVVNDEMRTSNPSIFAVGHAVEPGLPLAVQDHQTEVAAHNVRAPFWGRKRVEADEPPFSLRTSPPLARVGLTEAQARRRFMDVVVAGAPYFEGADGATGLIKLVGRRRRGRLLGAHIVGEGAAELVLFFDLLIRSEIPIPDVPDRRHFPLPGPTDAAYRALMAWTSAG